MLESTVTMLESAQQYGIDGHKVFPCCWPSPEGLCACGHRNKEGNQDPHIGNKVGKSPKTNHGLNNATSAKGAIDKFWLRSPLANIGMRTDGLIVVDIDVKHDGFASKALLEAQLCPLPKTRVHRTGGGGEHWIYQAPEGSDIRNRNGLLPGVDIKANGGYIIAPPSLHRSGKRYEVIDPSPIAPAPAWLIEQTTAKKQKTPFTPTTENQVIPIGERHSKLLSIAGSLRNNGISQSDIEATLLSVNRSVCENDPDNPLPDSEVLGIAASVMKYEPNQKAEYFQAPNAIFKLKINKHEQLVLLYLYRATHNNQEAFPSYNQIAKACNMSRPTAVDAIESLVKHGLIVKTPRPKNNLDWQSNTYKILPLTPGGTRGG